jgi:hypothetical protein
LISAGGFQAKFGDKLSSVLNNLSKTYSISYASLEASLWRKPCLDAVSKDRNGQQQ